MVRKHFAIFGSTGAGKSSGVALILRQIMQARQDLRIQLIDPHNEYGACFEERQQAIGSINRGALARACAEQHADASSGQAECSQIGRGVLLGRLRGEPAGIGLSVMGVR